MKESIKDYKTQIRVRYSETDQMGVVYHGNYAQYLEVGRVEWMRQIGASYKQMEADGVMLPVVSLELKFRKPALYDDLITVTTSLVKLPSAIIEFEYESRNSDDVLLVTASTALVFMDMKKKKPMRCPKYLMDQMMD